ncbi:hypothetical protein Dalu01_01732 [Deinococcus aluminii]|uniref:GGDEF domain-containing protein n=2 Tax=Deinococcus aluminii TaxID=1656885 RepID=A0ABP9XDA1_9DEIO
MGMRDSFLPLPEVLPPAHGWRGRGVFRREPGRRDVYQLVLPLVLLGTLLPLALPGPGMPAAFAATSPLLAGLLGLVLALSLVQRVPLRVLDLLLLVGGWVFMLGQLALLLFAPGVGGGTRAAAGIVPWFPLFLLMHSWLLGERWGRVLGRAALGATLLLTVAFAVGPLPARGAEGSALLNSMLQLLLAGGAALLCQQVATRRATSQARQGAWASIPDQERDALTGLPARRALERILNRHLTRHAPGLTVAVLTVDGLEQVEEERGIAFAQALRAHVARTLSAAIREGDVVGCLGDHTLAVLMRVPDGRFARTTCERLRLRVASRPLHGVLPTVSVGVVVWAGHPDGRALLADAQQALSSARASGGNRVHLSPGQAA